MESKRIRFGFVCSNANPFSSDMLPLLRMRSMECAFSGDKQFVVFTVEKPVKACDVLRVIEGFNSSAGEAALSLEKFQDSEDFIVTFEKGQRFLQHPFYAVIQAVKKVPSVEGEAQRIWEWSIDGIPESVRHKRVAGELSSDLVDDSIFPAAPKRDRTGPKQDIAKVCVILVSFSFQVALIVIANRTLHPRPQGASVLKKMAQSKMKWKPNSFPGSFGSTHMKASETGIHLQKGVSNVDVKIFSLVNEVTKSKDETIASKNYTIQLLESMLQTQKKCICVNGVE